MAQAPTEIERRILDYMVSYLRMNTYQPSIREIGEEFGIKSTKTVSEHLHALAEKGFLERDPSRSRGVKILGVDLAPEAVSIPLLDRLPDDRSVAASAAAQLTVDRRLGGAKGSFFVRARQAEIVRMGGEEGDYLLVEPARVEDLPDGAVVAARPGGGAPGYFRIELNGVGLRLQPLTGGPATHLEDASRLQLVGRVAALYRRMDGSATPTSLTPH